MRKTIGTAARFGAVAAIAWALCVGSAQAADFKVGDRVLVGSTQDRGTVIEVGQNLADGGTMVKVHLDKLGDNFPNVGVWYDSAMSRVTVTGAGPAPAAPPHNQQGALPAPPRAAPPPAGSSTRPAGKVAISTPNCQQAIRANYPPGGADQTMTINFLNFQIGGPQAYTATYANDQGGVGHTVQAAPVHAKYTVLTHYADPKADDELRTYDANYMCYNAVPSGDLVVEMVSRLPGGETPQYIHKP